MGYRYKPSRAKAKAYAMEMDDISTFCSEHGILASRSMDSYYFTVAGQSYRVSNHTVAASNAKARNWAGEQVREQYHPEGERDDVIYITAGKTRIRQIYSDICAGYQLDRRGNRVGGIA